MFRARYYILRGVRDAKPVNLIKKWGGAATMTKEDSEVKRLVARANAVTG